MGKTADGGKQANYNQGPKICACGAFDPEFKGYCTDCVQKLKTKFDYLIGKFNKLKDEYDDYN